MKGQPSRSQGGRRTFSLLKPFRVKGTDLCFRPWPSTLLFSGGSTHFFMRTKMKPGKLMNALCHSGTALFSGCRRQRNSPLPAERSLFLPPLDATKNIYIGTSPSPSPLTSPSNRLATGTRRRRPSTSAQRPPTSRHPPSPQRPPISSSTQSPTNNTRIHNKRTAHQSARRTEQKGGRESAPRGEAGKPPCRRRRRGGRWHRGRGRRRRGR